MPVVVTGSGVDGDRARTLVLVSPVVVHGEWAQ